MRAVPSFNNIANLFVPQTIDASFADDGQGMVVGIKDEETGDWHQVGHRDRIIEIGLHELALFAQLYDEAGTDALEARLPALQARQLIVVLRKFAAQTGRTGDMKSQH